MSTQKERVEAIVGFVNASLGRLTVPKNRPKTWEEMRAETAAKLREMPEGPLVSAAYLRERGVPIPEDIPDDALYWGPEFRLDEAADPKSGELQIEMVYTPVEVR